MTGREFLRNMSELPEDIMHDILSRLLPCQAFNIGASCRAWHAAWRTRPHLEFDSCEFSPENLERNKITLSRYCKEKIGIHTLIIVLDECELEVMLQSGRPKLIERFNQWIQTAVENGVKSISYCPYITYGGCLLLPPIILQAELLVELELVGWGGNELILPETENVRLYNLKSLSLWYTSFDERVFEKIVSSSPLIESLRIACCIGFDNLKVTADDKLKHFSLSLRIACRVEVQSSSLENFYWDKDIDWKEECPPLTLHACPNLKRLRLSSIFLTDEFFSNFGFKFPQLEDLSFVSCHLLPRTIISSQSVKRLGMFRNLDLEEVEIDVPSLESFRFQKRGGVTPQFIMAAASAHCTYEINGKMVHSLCMEVQSGSFWEEFL